MSHDHFAHSDEVPSVSGGVPDSRMGAIAARIEWDARPEHRAALHHDAYDSQPMRPNTFHWRDGMTFSRLACGCVFIASWDNRYDGRWRETCVAIIPKYEWQSIVTHMGVV